MPETRYIVEYETHGEGSAKRHVFIVEKSAREFAQRITTDDRAWPAVAIISREHRESWNHEWLHDCSFTRVAYVEGDDQTANLKANPR